MSATFQERANSEVIELQCGTCDDVLRFAPMTPTTLIERELEGHVCKGH